MAAALLAVFVVVDQLESCSLRLFSTPQLMTCLRITGVAPASTGVAVGMALGVTLGVDGPSWEKY